EEELRRRYGLGETINRRGVGARRCPGGMLEGVTARAVLFARPPVNGFDTRVAGEVGSAPLASPAALRIPTTGAPVDLERDLAEYEKAILLRALDQAGGVKKRAAELLGINYRSLRHRLQKY